MGYTHYWTIRPSKLRRWNDAIEACCAIIRTAEKDGYKLDVDLDSSGLWVNGVGDAAHETFDMPVNVAAARNAIELRKEQGYPNPNWDFCKTARKPYDTVVTACLAVLAEHGLEVSSDGFDHEWESGLYLAQKALGREVKNPIHKRKEAS